MGQVVLPALTSRIAKGRAFGSRLPEDRAQPIDPRPGEVRRGRPDRPEVGRRSQRELFGSQRADQLRKAVVREPPSVIERHEILRVGFHVCTVLFPWWPVDRVAAGSVRYRWRVGPIQVATRAAGAEASGSTLTT